MLLSFSVNSGSNGNCIYVEAGGRKPVRLLFDAGLSGKMAAERLAGHGRDIRAVDAVVISHDHSDHVRCAGVFNRKFGLPVYMTPATHRAAGHGGLGAIADLRHFRAGETLDFGDVRVETYRTPHDASDPVVFVVTDGRRRLGILTDLGHVFAGLEPLLAGLDAAYLESNYDPHLLETGPYPDFLKARIAGKGGHISNAEAAELVHTAANGRMQWVALAHLSDINNTPQLARRTHHEIVGAVRPVHLATRFEAGELLPVE